MVHRLTKDDWKSLITVFGEQFVTIALAISMLESLALLSDMGKPV